VKKNDHIIKCNLKYIGDETNMSNDQHVLSTCRLVEFQDARIDEVSIDFNSYLIVSGLKPYANMRIELHPRMYIKRPDYWAIEVVGILSRIALPAVTPYEVIIPIDFPVGKKGIRIIGAGNCMKVIDCEYKPKKNPDDGGKDGLFGPNVPRT
jgi:hypothetical protein